MTQKQKGILWLKYYTYNYYLKIEGYVGLYSFLRRERMFGKLLFHRHSLLDIEPAV